MTGLINSFQSMGAVDGPGLRSIVFMQGCPLRCAYCHNPETWDMQSGQKMTTDELVSKIEQYRPYIIETGGVTVSGGEPLLQAPFVTELFHKLKEKGYHTTLDTSGIGNLTEAQELLETTDLVLCDVKFTDSKLFTDYCKGNLQKVYHFLSLTASNNVPVWIRQVIVPTINDTKEDVLALKKFASNYSNVVKIELLPFRNICESKYDNMGIYFSLQHIPPCPKETIESLSKYL